LALLGFKVTLFPDQSLHQAYSSYANRTGSSVIDALLADGTFTHRAITRDPTSEKALKLKARGVEVVQVDLNDEDTTALDRALGGSEVVYSVCVYFDSSRIPTL
jgi:saccharopine dehydrogenase-like NADP-dependent oxidoreductase